MEATTKIPLRERINLRLVVFTLAMGLVLGYPIYLFLDEAVSGGIKDYGEYKQVNLQAMSTFSFDQTNGTIEQVPPKWRELDGQRVVLEGEMWAGGSAALELVRFDLVYSRSKCCFSGPPQVQHFVKSRMKNNQRVPYYDSMVRVTGMLHVKVIKTDAGSVESVYQLDVEQIQPI